MYQLDLCWNGKKNSTSWRNNHLGSNSWDIFSKLSKQLLENFKTTKVNSDNPCKRQGTPQKLDSGETAASTNIKSLVLTFSFNFKCSNISFCGDPCSSLLNFFSYLLFLNLYFPHPLSDCSSPFPFHIPIYCGKSGQSPHPFATILNKSYKRSCNSRQLFSILM